MGERFIEYSRFCCDMKYFKLEIIYWFFELLSRFSVGLCCEINYGERREAGSFKQGGIELRTNKRTCFCFNYGRYKSKQSLKIGSEIETISLFHRRLHWAHVAGIFQKKSNKKKLSPINVSSFDELINCVVAWEFCLAIKILHLPNVHHNYIFHSQQYLWWTLLILSSRWKIKRRWK